MTDSDIARRIAERIMRESTFPLAPRQQATESMADVIRAELAPLLEAVDAVLECTTIDCDPEPLAPWLVPRGVIALLRAARSGSAPDEGRGGR